MSITERSLELATAGAPVSTEIVRYEGAEHGFACDERPSFNAAASDDAWTRTLQWPDRHLEGSVA